MRRFKLWLEWGQSLWAFPIRRGLFRRSQAQSWLRFALLACLLKESPQKEVVGVVWCLELWISWRVWRDVGRDSSRALLNYLRLMF